MEAAVAGRGVEGRVDLCWTDRCKGDIISGDDSADREEGGGRLAGSTFIGVDTGKVIVDVVDCWAAVSCSSSWAWRREEAARSAFSCCRRWALREVERATREAMGMAVEVEGGLG